MELWEDISEKFVKPRLHASVDLTPLDLINDDDGEIDETEEPNPDVDPIAGLAVILEYRCSKGSSTQRLITCRRYQLNGEHAYIYAFCHMRRRLRSFRIDRIDEIFDPSTGESLSPVGDFFANFQPDQIHKSKYGWGLSGLQKAGFTALLNALVFIAKCDKSYHHLEKSSLEDFIGRFWLRMEIASEPDCDSILNYADRLAPDAETFWVALHRIGENSKLTRILKESVVDMIEADGFFAKEEFYWGSKIDEFFRSNG